MTVIPDNSNTILVVEHFGFIEFVSPVTNEVIAGGVQLPTNTIFQISGTKIFNAQQNSGFGPWEYAIATYSGLAFIHISRNRAANIS